MSATPSLPEPPPLPGAAPAEPTPSLRKMAWPVLLSVGVLAVILVLTYEPGVVDRMAENLNPGLLWLAFGTIGLRVLLGGARLRYISHRTISLIGGIRGSVAWDFMSAVTPSAVGGAPLAAYFVAKDNRIPVGEATAIMLFSMLMDQIWFAVSIPFILVASFYIEVFPPSLGAIGAGTLTAYFVGMMCWAYFFAYATLIRPEILEKIATWVVKLKWLRRFEDRVRTELVEMRRRAETLRGQPPLFFFIGFLWSAGIWLTRYFTLLFIVLSVVPALDALTFVLRTGAMMLTAMAVPTPGGSGGIEGLYVLFLGPLMPKALVGPTIVTWRVLAYHFFIAVGSAMTVLAVRRRFLRKSDMPAAAKNTDGTTAPTGDGATTDAPPTDASAPPEPTDARTHAA